MDYEDNLTEIPQMDMSLCRIWLEGKWIFSTMLLMEQKNHI